MLQFLSSLFASSDKYPLAVNNALISAAIDRVVDGTDKRLRGYGGYRKQLQDSVESAVIHIINMVDALPSPVEISSKSFSNDPGLHAFFSSFTHFQEKVGGARSVREYMKQAHCDEPVRLYGLLTMEWEEINRLGTILQGDMIQREVMQKAVNFFNHRYLGPSALLDEAKTNVKKRIFDYMIEIALGKIIAERNMRAELKQQQVLLKRKLAMMKAGNWGLGEMLSPSENSYPDLNLLSAEIETIETELSKLGASHELLKRNMQIIKDTMSNPGKQMAAHNINMRLDNMNIKVDESSSVTVNNLDLIEFYSSRGETRIVLPCWYPVNEIPPMKDFISEAKRYL